MKLIDSSVEIIKQNDGLQGIYEQIELAGRTAYKSLDSIKYDKNGRSKTAESFVNKMIDLKHNSTLEHGTVYLIIPADEAEKDFWLNQKYSTTYYDEEKQLLYITTNYRVIVENNRNEDLKFLSECTDKHEKRITARFICDRGVSHEFVRHRVFSFLMESQRYCNYSKDKFNAEITFIKPYWYDTADKDTKDYFEAILKSNEDCYLRLINRCKLKPQAARAILPNATKTELIMTGTATQWINFGRLRCTSKAHPDAMKLAIDALYEMDILIKEMVISSIADMFKDQKQELYNIFYDE